MASAVQGVVQGGREALAALRSAADAAADRGAPLAGDAARVADEAADVLATLGSKVRRPRAVGPWTLRPRAPAAPPALPCTACQRASVQCSAAPREPPPMRHPPLPRAQAQEGPAAWRGVTEAGYELRNALEMAAAVVVRASKAGGGERRRGGLIGRLFRGGSGGDDGGDKDAAKARARLAVRGMGGWAGS